MTGARVTLGANVVAVFADDGDRAGEGNAVATPLVVDPSLRANTREKLTVAVGEAPTSGVVAFDLYVNLVGSSLV